MTLGLVCDACDALNPVSAAACTRCGTAFAAVGAVAPAVDRAPPVPASSGATPVDEPGADHAYPGATVATAPPLHEDSPSDSPAAPAGADPAAGLDLDTLDTPSPSAGAGAAPSPGTLPAPSTRAGSRYCTSCGAAVPATHRFCGECGLRLDAPQAADGAHAQAAGRTQMMVPHHETGRARLILIKGDGYDSISYHLAGSEHVVGRSDGAILFPDDPLVSPRHANFFYRGAELHVRDESSRNGVFVRIRGSARIAADQPFLVGEQLLTVQPATVEGIASSDPDGTYYYGSPRRPARTRILQVLAGGDLGMVMRIPGDVTSIGREGNHVNFPDDPFISGRHAQVIPLDDGGFRLVDVGSKNGTFVRIVAECHLEHGDFVFVGQQLLRVEIV